MYLDFLVVKTLYRDYKTTAKSQEFEESSVADRLKIKLLFNFSIGALFIFFLLLLYYVIAPMQMGW